MCYPYNNITIIIFYSQIKVRFSYFYFLLFVIVFDALNEIAWYFARKIMKKNLPTSAKDKVDNAGKL